MSHRGEGPIPARVMLVGEAWGEYEDQEGKPFVGPSGSELNRMLQEAGILRSECFVTNLVNRRPPDNDMTKWVAMKKKDITPQHVRLLNKWVMPVVVEGYNQLLAEIKMVEPNLIIAFGNFALWALTQNWGIRNWRGSLLRADLPQSIADATAEILPPNPKVIPTIHPAAVLREWSQRGAVLNDLRRAKKHMGGREYSFPTYNFIVRPTIQQVIATLSNIRGRLDSGEELWLDADIETGIKVKVIKCIGIGWSRTNAICIPFTAVGRPEGYWSLEEEAAIIWLLYKILTHKKAKIRWQNGLFDVQYLYRYWHFIANCAQDTMISQHAIFSDLPKALAYQCSIYVDHYVFWKEEGKGMEEARNPNDEERGWIYNCKDCVYMREAGETELQMIETFSASNWPAARSVHTFQQAMFWPVLAAMNRGVRIVEKNKADLDVEIKTQIDLRQQFLNDVLGFEVNVNSPKQMMELFYTILNQPPIWTRAKKGQPSHITCDDEALQKIAAREPLCKPLVNAIADIRTMRIFRNNFVLAKVDVDDRMRCSFNIGGSESGKSAPKTYRLSSSENAFDTGTNLQTIPSEKSKSVGKAAQRGHLAVLGDPYQLPNIRSMFGPDGGYTFFDQDLSRADLQVMAWDANDWLLKEALKKDVDIHLLNVYVLDAKEPPPLEELVETHPKYWDHRGPRKLKREFAKVFCHATDYLGKSRTVAAATGRSVYETERAQKIYLGTYKGIKAWQESIINQVTKYRFVENRFGYRWFIFDRIDDQVMPEAVAWIPQSTVSIVINKIWMNIFQGVKEENWDLSQERMNYLMSHPANGIEVLLQVHDSLVGQFPTHKKESCLIKLKELSQIVIPYDDPLIIPTGIGTSDVTWGAC